MPVASTQPVYPPPPGFPVEAQWGQAASEHVLQRFASVADRDAKWTLPPRGAVCITLDSDTLWYMGPSGWRQTLLYPAQAGPYGTTYARFGHISASINAGYLANNTGSELSLQVSNGGSIGMWQRNSADTSYDLISQMTAVRSRINNWLLADHHPAHPGWAGIWRQGNDGANAYILINAGVGANTYINGSVESGLRVGNVPKVSAGTDRAWVNDFTFTSNVWRGGWFNIGCHPGNAVGWTVSVHPTNGNSYLNGLGHLGLDVDGIPRLEMNSSIVVTRGKHLIEGLCQATGDGSYSFLGSGGSLYNGGVIWARYNNGGSTWYGHANFLAEAENTTAGASIALHAIGIGAAQFNVRASTGSGMIIAIDYLGTSYNYVGGVAFASISAARFKKEIRSLRLGGKQHVFVHRDPRSDRVEVPDIMGLRPVTYRPLEPVKRLLKVDPDGDDQDKDNWRAEPYGLDEVHGRESRRERLGLIAEEVQHVLPCAVLHTDTDEAFGIDYNQITVALLDHVQRLTEEVAVLRYRLDELEHPVSGNGNGHVLTNGHKEMSV